MASCVQLVQPYAVVQSHRRERASMMEKVQSVFDLALWKWISIRLMGATMDSLLVSPWLKMPTALHQLFMVWGVATRLQLSKPWLKAVKRMGRWVRSVSGVRLSERSLTAA